MATVPAPKNVGALNVQASASSITPALPAFDPGDLALALLFGLGNTGGPAFSPPAGWTQVAGLAGGITSLYIFRRVLESGDGDPTFTLPTNPCHARVVTFSDAHPTSPIGSVGAINSGNSGTHTSNGIVPGYDFSKIFYVDLCRANTALTTPSGFTSFFDSGGTNARSSGGTKDGVVGVSSGNISTSGGASFYNQVQIEIRANFDPKPRSYGVIVQ